MIVSSEFRLWELAIEDIVVPNHQLRYHEGGGGVRRREDGEGRLGGVGGWVGGGGGREGRGLRERGFQGRGSRGVV